MTRILIVLSAFALVFIHTAMTHASDWVFVAGDKVRAFSVDTQHELSGSPIALNRYARDLERSPGGGVLYLLHDSGRLGLIRARSRALRVAPGAFGAQADDAAVSPNRADIWISGGNLLLHQQDAAGFGPSYGPETFSRANRLEATAVASDGTVYLYDRPAPTSPSHGWIWSFDPRTGHKVRLLEVPFSVHEMIVDSKGRYLLAIGQSGRGIGVLLIDRKKGTQLDFFQAALGGPYRLAAGKRYDKFFVGTDQGILPFIILDPPGIKPRLILPFQSPYQPNSRARVIDLAVDSNQQLQVLYEDSSGGRYVGEFDPYGYGPNRSFPLPDENMNFIEVVPESDWKGPRIQGLGERLAGLMKALEAMKMEDPFGGLPLNLQEGELRPELYEAAYFEAFDFLKALGKEGVTRNHVAEFIAAEKDISPTEANLYLDEVLILNPMK